MDTGGHGDRAGIGAIEEGSALVAIQVLTVLMPRVHIGEELLRDLIQRFDRVGNGAVETIELSAERAGDIGDGDEPGDFQSDSLEAERRQRGIGRLSHLNGEGPRPLDQGRVAEIHVHGSICERAGARSDKLGQRRCGEVPLVEQIVRREVCGDSRDCLVEGGDLRGEGVDSRDIGLEALLRRLVELSELAVDLVETAGDGHRALDRRFALRQGIREVRQVIERTPHRVESRDDAVIAGFTDERLDAHEYVVRRDEFRAGTGGLQRPTLKE